MVKEETTFVVQVVEGELLPPVPVGKGLTVRGVEVEAGRLLSMPDLDGVDDPPVEEEEEAVVVDVEVVVEVGEHPATVVGPAV